MILLICERAVRNIEIRLLRWTAIRNVGKGFPTTPNLTPSPKSKTHKYCEKLDFPHSNIKTLLWSSSCQRRPVAKLFVHMFRRQLWNIFEIATYVFSHFTMISVHPFSWYERAVYTTAVSKQWLHRFAHVMHRWKGKNGQVDSTWS